MRLPDRILLLIAGTCARLGVDGHRADIVTARTATALAALDGADEVTRDHVKRAAKLALAHRRRRGPLQQPGLDDSELDQALNDSEPDDDPPPTGGDNGRAPSAGEDAPGDDGPPARESSPAPADRPYRAGAPSRERIDAPDTPGKAPLLTLAGKGRGAAGRRSRTTTGEPVDAKPAEGTVTDLALAATLRAAAIHGGPLVPVRAHPLRPRGQPDRVLRGRVRVDGRAPPHGAGQGRRARACSPTPTSGGTRSRSSRSAATRRSSSSRRRAASNAPPKRSAPCPPAGRRRSRRASSRPS